LDSAPPRSTASTWNWPAVRSTAKSLSGGSICKVLDKQQTSDRLLPRTAHDQPLLPELLVGNWGLTAVLWNKLTSRKCYLLSGLHNVPTAITQTSGVGVGRLDPSNTPEGRTDQRRDFQRHAVAQQRTTAFPKKADGFRKDSRATSQVAIEACPMSSDATTDLLVGT